MSDLSRLPLQTPALVYDESKALATVEILARLRETSGCGVLYSVKAFPFLPFICLVAPRLDGFSVSSLFEARLAAMAGKGTLHMTTPGFVPAEIAEVGTLCRYVAFNSLEQFRRHAPRLGPSASAGLRVNPKISFLDDPRYDPCCPFSKLGVPVDVLERTLAGDGEFAGKVQGLHLHIAFSYRHFAPLALAVEKLESMLIPLLPSLAWINLGGGYLFDCEHDLDDLCRIVQGLRARHGVRVFFEPGKGVVGEAGYLVSTVIDLLESDGKRIAVLDTSVNHTPEAFEYQRRPQPDWQEPDDGHLLTLAGGTCLAGDVFGDYRVADPLQIGDRVVFRNMGAYTLVKASRFNGHNLPSIYAWDGKLAVRQMKQYSFADYLGQWTGADEPCRSAG